MRIVVAVIVTLWAASAMAEVVLDSPNGTRFRIDDTGTGALVGPGAFAGWPRLCVRLDAGGDCLAGDVYGAGGAAGVSELNGRQTHLAVARLAGLDVRRKVFVPSAGGNLANGFVRYLDTLSNPTGAPIVVSVRIGTVGAGNGRLGVAGMTIWRTSSDDAVAAPADRWLVVDDDNPGGGAAAIGALMHGAGARVVPGALGLGFPTVGDDRALAWDFRQVRIEPGQSRSFLTVVVHEAGRAAAIDEVDNLLRVREADVLFGLTDGERNGIVNFDVTPDDGAALADAGGPYNADEGEQIQLSAAGSFDPEGQPLVYDWDFDGDGLYDDANGINAFHTVPDNGVVEIGLRVTDQGGKVDTDTARITVVNVAPRVDGVNTNSPLEEGSTLEVDVQATDPGDDALTYDFDWDGDGDFDEVGVELNRWEHVYPDDGVFDARVRVSDDDGDRHERAFTVEVVNVPPRVFNVTVPPLVAEGSDFQVLVVARDPGDDAVIYRYDLDGDGQPDQQGEDLDRITARFPDDGLFTITVTVCDDQDACSEPRDQAVNIGNVAPSIVSVTSDGPVPEGSPVTVTIQATDPGGAGDPLVYSFDWDNDGEFADDVLDQPQAVQQHVFAQQGRYFVGVQVRDDDNGRAVGNVEIVVENVGPSVELTGPAAGAEGSPLPFVCAATDPGADTLRYDWDLNGDGEFEVLAVPDSRRDAVFPQEGNYIVRCRVSDGDGGLATDSAEVVINNVRPTLDIEVDSPQNEGAEVVVRAIATDPGGDTLRYTFDFDDDGVAEIVDAQGEGAEIGRHVYGDQGLYTVRVQVFDGTDGIDATAVMDIRNVDPAVRLTTNSPVDEGGQLVLTAEITEPGDDTVTLAWDINGDRVPDVEEEAEGDMAELIVEPPDDARFEITLIATDEDGGRSEVSAAVVVRNVAPSFPDFVLPPAQEGEDYRGTVPAIDPAGPNDPLAFSLINPPAQIGIDRNSGQIIWQPSYDDYLNQPLAITVRVTDGDGGSAETDVELTVIARDEDGDQLPDSYEELTCDPDAPDRCLDPDDPTDARDDPDGDGRDNLTEWREQTDPYFYEGPETPLLQAPRDGLRIPTLTPALVVSWVDNPIGGPVAIEYAIYSDAALGAEVVISEPVDQAEEEGVPTGWQPPEGLLFEDQWYWWRARSVSGEARSAWSDPYSFRTNATNEAPTAPILVQPTNMAVVDTRTPTFRAMPSTDIDEDPLRYIFNIYDVLTFTGSGRVTADGVVFELENALSENAVIEWEVVAVDDAGGMTTSERWSLRVDSENAAPTPPEFIAPAPMGNIVPVVERLQPTLVVGNSVDEDGEDIRYVIGVREVDGAIVSQSDPLPAAGGQAQWMVDEELEENGDYLAFALAMDARDTESPITEQRIFVSAVDEPPATPEPQSPSDGVTIAADDAVMIWSTVTDPERLEPVIYIVEYCNSSNICTEVRRERPSFSIVDIAVPGEQYTWSVQAEDPAGNKSRPSNRRVFAINRSAERVEGCGCDASDGSPGPWSLTLLGIGLLGLRRRRRTARDDRPRKG